MNSFLFSVLKNKIKNKGFTLIELLVVISICSIIFTAIVVQQSKWNDRFAVTSQAYELALMVRQAQTYGLGVREYQSGPGDKFDTGYGIYFSDSQPGQYIFFADRNKNKIYDSGEAIETKVFSRGVTINRFCDVTSAGVETCNGGNLRQVGISFVRPEPKSNILFLNGGGSPTPTALNLRAYIYLQSPRGVISLVKVEGNGQVSVIQ